MSKVTTRQKVFLTLTEPSSSSLAYFISFYFDALAALSMVTMCAETVAPWNSTPAQQLRWWMCEFVLTANFFFDFLLKLSTAPKLLPYILKRPMFWIDFLGLAPFFAEQIFDFLSSGSLEDQNFSLKSLRVLRLLRFFRLSRIAYENFPDVRLFIQAVRRSKLAIAFLGMYVFGAGLFFASCIYFAETAACTLSGQDKIWYYVDGKACVIQDMFEAWWYTLVTMTTVGYGDVVVRSEWGRIITVLVMITSLIFLALPSAIFAANLTEMYLERRLAREHSTGSHHGSRVRNVEEGTAGPVEMERLLSSIQSATDKVNSGMTAISAHLTAIQSYQQELEKLLHDSKESKVS